ncbi:TonB-dependent receptor plug domain-containing protein [Sphingosinicella terrae]|uniref:TonB-dependent receptor plug domain-containing protein n=1 Tax=Sphingosinicella terrae TaxID=2172047 RepID=UPI000E0DD274|nr:TonB-dependent receptor [Sphingosinicella terrae]
MSRIGLPKSLLLALLCGTAFTPALAQEAPAPIPPEAGPEEAAEEAMIEEEEELEGEAIVVTGVRRPQRGAVPGDIQPELQLDPREIRAYGAGSLNELLEALAPQTASGRGRDGGRPVILLDGRRISSFSEIRDIPPEALLRVDILPEEAALQYGYRADQRVVNFVLRRRFRAITTEAQYGFATEGGRPSFGAEANLLRINRDGRWSVGAEYRRSDDLREIERGLGDPFRTLLPAMEQAAVTGTYSRALSQTVSGTVNGRFEIDGNDSRLGLAPDAGFGLARPLDRERDGWNGHLGLTLNGDLSEWRWSLTSNYDRSRSVTLTDSRLDAFAARDRAETRAETANAELLFAGPVLDLPAGDLRTSLTAGAERQGLASETIRGGAYQDRDLSRGRMHAQATVDIPIASRRRGFLGAIGNLSANLNGRVEHFSDFGTLTTLGYGLNWTPIDAINMRASVTHEEGAPSMQQLGDPVIATSGVRVLDFVRGETVDITRIDGGNPALLADKRRVFSLGARIRPIEDEDLVLTANYTDSRIRNPIASFPTATPEIEAAFPDRFVRDADGRLLSIDARPVNFLRSDREELRWGVNYSRRVGPEPPPRGERRRQRSETDGAEGGTPEGNAGERPRGEGRGFGGRGFGRGGFGRGGGRGGRLQLSAYHTVRFEDRVIIREGLPPLDFLNGSAAGNRGGRPRHEVEAQAGLTVNGIGARLTANWQSGTSVRNVAGGDLDFSPAATINLRLFANLGQQRKLVEAVPFLRGSRLSLVVDNLFDSRPEVRDAFGETPLAYRGAYLDPLGRSVRISFRKQFF